ncbi:hypothetical protein Hypma_008087 [Hypsizygus marmoreus]|uniref:Tyrosine specific protein phosphatases domain-containing protein n=1 Tax=Hypsizygus marmoreus TaxID=39966 RepID=A0A369JZ11_HYPMA|nr:hypothetical protein Hypma_008087 [Hypsizygus marmoreus]
MSTLFYPHLLDELDVPDDLQLAPLASQHHTSEYNRLKFGPQGCPIRYLPLSVQLPQFFHELRQRQIQYSQERSWWHCDRPTASPPSPVILGSRGAQDSDAILLQEEINAAITTPLSQAQANFFMHPSIKTSSTHPINISSIVPPELIALISSHLLFASSSGSRSPPTVFEVPASFTLDRLTSHRQSRVQIYSSPVPPSPTQVVIKHLHTRTTVSEALQAAINGRMTAEEVHTAPGPEKHDPPPGLPRPTSMQTLPSEKLPVTLHSNTSSISLSLSLTIAEASSSSSPRSTHFVSKSSASHSYNRKETLSPSRTRTRRDDDNSQEFSRYFPRSPSPQSPSLTIGNLFLSSCPGKKVRLQGPVKGRTGVCRDLDTDLKRIKELGVGCIICCLDDGELEFLGAPWSEYENSAKSNGIDVLRIPTPEGLAPLAPTFLDAHLTKVINTYTLRGIPVLVHCRGGVGRAGVIACCWLIRLGLCGWVEPGDIASHSLHSPAPSLAQCNDFGGRHSGPVAPALPAIISQSNMTATRKDTIQFVEKIIAVVRRRRSMKAVETYEQVRFLVDFVEYLESAPSEVV